MVARRVNTGYRHNVPMPHRIERLPRDQRGYPIPATLKRDGNGHANFAGIDSGRRFIVGAFDWCGICSLPLGTGPRFLLFVPQRDGQADDPIAHLEAPMHEVCAYYAAQICPFLLDPHAVIRNGPGKGVQSKGALLAGYRRTLALMHSPNGPTFLLESCSSSATLDEHVPERYAELLAEDHPVRMGPAARRLLDMFEAPDPGRVFLAALVLTAGCVTVSVLPEWGKLRKLAVVAGLRSSEDLSGDPRWEGLIAARKWIHEIRTDTPPFILESIRTIEELLYQFNNIPTTE